MDVLSNPMLKSARMWFFLTLQKMLSMPENSSKPGDYRMNFNRAGGILLHPTSLPGRYGIGDLGPEAYQFIDSLASTGCKLWQILPLGPTGYGDSPYQCFSAFAGNPYLISLDALMEDGLLIQEDFANMPTFDAARVDYGLLIPWKLDLLQKAFSRLASTSESFRQEFQRFRKDNATWLDDY